MVTKVEAEVGDGIVVTAPTSLTNTDIDYGSVVRTVGEEVGCRREKCLIWWMVKKVSMWPCHQALTVRPCHQALTVRPCHQLLTMINLYHKIIKMFVKDNIS